MAEIAEDLSVNASTANYHLKILTRAGLLTVIHDGKCLRYFENHGTWDAEHDVLSAMLQKKAFRIVTAIVHEPGLDQASLSKSTGLPQSTVSFHLNRLLRLGVIRKERSGGNNVNHYHPTSKLNGVLSRLERAKAMDDADTIAVEAYA